MKTCFHVLRAAAFGTALLVIGPLQCSAEPLTIMGSGTSAAGNQIAAKAEFSIEGSDLLVVKLSNISDGPSLAPADLLSSFYFDVLTFTTPARPTLGYSAATGQVYVTDKITPDTPATYTPPLDPNNPGPSLSFPNPPQPSDLRAFVANDDTWQFLAMTPGASPYAGFGVGTVGNSDLTPNNFNGLIVDGRNFSIYKGDVTTQALDDALLVKDSITFKFSGFTGLTLSNISPQATFGFGTGPDSIISVPEPGGIAIATGGALSCLVWFAGRRRQTSVMDAA
jgi:hypothetical protein